VVKNLEAARIQLTVSRQRFPKDKKDMLYLIKPLASNQTPKIIILMKRIIEVIHSFLVFSHLQVIVFQILVRVDLESQNLAVKEEERLFLSCKS
jgi:hypothetical protein